MTSSTSTPGQKAFSYGLATFSGLTAGAAAAAVSILLLAVLTI